LTLTDNFDTKPALFWDAIGEGRVRDCSVIGWFQASLAKPPLAKIQISDRAFNWYGHRFREKPSIPPPSDSDPPQPPLKSYALATSFVTILKALFHKAFKKHNCQQS
jgi:hypothetical protein